VGHRDFLQDDKPVFAKDTSKLYSLRKLYFYLAVLLYNNGFLLTIKGKR
jgi:hypothetical protein